MSRRIQAGKERLQCYLSLATAPSQVKLDGKYMANDGGDPMRVLFIGGTGVISSACSELAVQRGINLYLLNRGQSSRPTPAGAKIIQADIRQTEETARALSGLDFDAVVDWIAYTPEQVQADIELFRGRTRQYIFISSASVYQKPPRTLPITESTPLHNPFWEYSRLKAACEAVLMDAYRQEDFPTTIVRPSHTYDRTLFPFTGGYTQVGRMRAGKPVVVHGDGTSLWTLTNHRDFAVGLVGLLGHPLALGEAFHITSDEWLSWNQINEIMAEAAGVKPRLVHAPSELIARYDARWGESLLGDKSFSALFDNSKIRRLVPEFKPVIPFWQGAREIMAWYDADPSRQVINSYVDAAQDQIIQFLDRRL
ncbi:MAG TPA: SDR family oxidoreductase [Anaerolineales bacterium]|nr:SDR family oxidoreductase [Anaerolineales bacterium]